MKLKVAGTAIATAVWLMALPASAAVVNEVEPNDTQSTAQFIINSGSVIVINGGRTFANPSDDFFAFNVLASGLLNISTLSAASGADSIIGLYNPAGLLVASNDDAPGLAGMSALQYTVLGGMTGRYTLAISGYNPGLLACTATVTQCYDTNGDFIFDTFVAGGGAGGSTGWDYAITIGGASLVPEPAPVVLLLLSLPLLWWRRRTLAPAAA